MYIIGNFMLAGGFFLALLGLIALVGSVCDSEDS